MNVYYFMINKAHTRLKHINMLHLQWNKLHSHLSFTLKSRSQSPSKGRRREKILSMALFSVAS